MPDSVAVNFLIEPRPFPLAVMLTLACSDGRSFSVDLDSAQAFGLSDDLRSGKVKTLQLADPAGSISVQMSDDIRIRLADELKIQLATAIPRRRVNFDLNAS